MSEIIERVADVLQAEVGLDRLAATALARRTVAAIREPDRFIIKAMCKAMSPEHRPTAAYVGVADKHRIRWRAAIDRIVRVKEPTA